jgi:hypothetical protein
MKKVILAVIFLLSLSALTFAQNNIRQIDFNNFTYQTFCADEDLRQIPVKNSEFLQESQTEDNATRLYFKVFSVSHGDLNGDGKEEAFVMTLCNRGSETYLSEGFVFTLKNGKPMLVTRIEGGDRAHGGLRSAKIEKGIFIVERYAAGEANNVCCPEYIIETSYKWNGTELVTIGVSNPRELYPPTPVAFEKGKNTANLNVSLPIARAKRYSVKARAGQTLTISTNSKTLAVNLIRGAADLNETDRAFVAVMYENGEYVIQFENTGDANVEAVVKIEIKDNL